MRQRLPIVLFIAFFLVVLNALALGTAFRESGENYSAASVTQISNDADSPEQSMEKIKRVGFPYSAKGLLAWTIAFGITLVVSSLTIKALSSASRSDKSRIDILN